MERIGLLQYREILSAATVIEQDAYGEKVLVQTDGTLVKIFRRKRWLSTALFYPYARRFVRNARMLAANGILTVRVVGVVACPEVHRHLVTYQPLPGTTLRKALSDAGAGRSCLLAEFARFVAVLHRKGVYFRSLHFGNVIVPPDGCELGLIDVADLSLRRGELPLRLRARNFRHMLRYREDVGFLLDFGAGRFVDHYLDAADLSPRGQKRFRELLAEVSGDVLSPG